MAECRWTLFNYFYLTLYADVTETNSAGGYNRVHWSLVLHHSKLYVNNGNFEVNIDGNIYNISSGSINTSTPADRVLGSGDTIIYSGNRNIGFSFVIKANWRISGRNIYGGSASGSLFLPQLAVNPTLPTYVGANNPMNANTLWIDKDVPFIDVNWRGATSGTYTIDAYSIELTKNGWQSYQVPRTVYTNQRTWRSKKY